LWKPCLSIRKTVLLTLLSNRSLQNKCIIWFNIVIKSAVQHHKNTVLGADKLCKIQYMFKKIFIFPHNPKNFLHTYFELLCTKLIFLYILGEKKLPENLRRLEQKWYCRKKMQYHVLQIHENITEILFDLFKCNN
jgi:hypothetical protein